MTARGVFLGAALMLVWATSASASPGVLVLSGEERVLPGYIEFETGLRAELGLPDADIQYSAEFMDVVRFGGADREALWREFLRRKYSGHDVRAIVVVASTALNFILKYQSELFPGVPVFVTAVSANTLGDRLLPSNFSVVSFSYEFAKTIQLARQLQPNAVEVVVAIGTSDADLEYEALVRKELPPGPGALPVRYLKGLPLEEIIREVSTLTPSSIGLAVPLFRDGAGRTRIPLNTAKAILTASGAPFYSSFSTTIGSGVIGGQMTTYADMGRRAGELVRRVLGGEALSGVPKTTLATSNVVIDWRALRRWDLDEARLAAGADVRFRELSLWQAYRWRILAGIALCVVQTIFLGHLILQKRRRDAAELAVHASRTELAHLSRVALVAELSSSLAHELNQPLTAVLSNAQASQRFLNAPVPDLDLVRQIVGDIADDTRRAGAVIGRLRTLLKKTEPHFTPLECTRIIADALKVTHADMMARDVLVVVDVPNGLPAITGDGVQLQQVLINLLINAADAMRGAPAHDRRIMVRAETQKGGVVLTVADNGTGIPGDRAARLFEPFFTTKADGLGMGLSISRAIVETHGGRLWAANNPVRGATFFLLLPATP